jgi:8-oxo-dGTP pyrophosphatase MutT (NUDIX family)
MLTFHLTGRFSPHQVRCQWSPSTFSPNPHITRLIDEEWQKALATPGIHLFDGPMCRLESFSAHQDTLSLAFSRTSYKSFLGTNMRHPELADQFGPSALANPTGLSCALVSSEGTLLLGRRNHRVAYYPGRIHPFAGSLEPRDDLDIFAGAQRELTEELGLQPSDIQAIQLIALIEDQSLRQPELIFLVHSLRTQTQIEQHLAPEEHRAIIPIPTPSAADTLLAQQDLTPVGRAAVMLWLKDATLTKSPRPSYFK